jgi:competence protein ComGC
MSKQNLKAFSLVELSIVVIILGLLVASVTVGKDLISAAKMRGLVSQLKSFDTQISTFKLKYDDLPGDINNANKRGLGDHNGDGDGLIEDGTNDTTPDTIGYEISYFWEHLNRAGFADGAYDGDEGNGIVGETLPQAKHGGGIVVYAENSQNYYHVGIHDSGEGTPAVINFANTLIPEEAFSVDNKIDDGLPLKGKLLARSASCTDNPSSYTCASTPITTASGGASQTEGEACVLQAGAGQNASLDEYDFTTTVVRCQIRIEMNN